MFNNKQVRVEGCTECIVSYKTGKTRGPVLHKEAQLTSQKQEKQCQSCHFLSFFVYAVKFSNDANILCPFISTFPVDIQ